MFGRYMKRAMSMARTTGLTIWKSVKWVLAKAAARLRTTLASILEWFRDCLSRLLIPRCYFDRDNCRDGLEALRHYHRAYSEKTRQFRDQPVHDWSSHAADAFRTAAIGLQTQRLTDGTPPQRDAEMAYNPYEYGAA